MFSAGLIPPYEGDKENKADHRSPDQAGFKAFIIPAQISDKDDKRGNPQHGSSNELPVPHFEHAANKTNGIVGEKRT